MKFIPKILMAVLALLALNALAYGAYFVLSPEEGIAEFSYGFSGQTNETAIYLVGLVGICFLGAMSLAILAIVMLARRNRSGLSVSLVLGGAYLAVGVFAAWNNLMVDALIYGGFGIVVCLLAGLAWKVLPS